MTPALRLLALILSSAAPTALADTILRRIPRAMLQIIKVGWQNPCRLRVETLCYCFLGQSGRQ